VTVFLGVKLAPRGRVGLEDFERAVSAIREVQTVEHILGLYDYRLRVVARDMDDRRAPRQFAGDKAGVEPFGRAAKQDAGGGLHAA
jgi:DNA-binding Lrp family transcriptional regulator